jgi:hypothetical protein
MRGLRALIDAGIRLAYIPGARRFKSFSFWLGQGDDR